MENAMRCVVTRKDTFEKQSRPVENASLAYLRGSGAIKVEN
jgi:hypothetical protein